ncbi:MAG: TetR/AcrR family transcriptional regulator [Sporolactobacillus sp.]
MNKRELQRKQTYEAILAAAERVYATDGFVKPTAQQIANEAGVAHGTLFLHFHSQENLLLSVLKKLNGTIATKIHESSELDGTLTGILATHLAAIEASEPLYAHLVMDMPQLPEEAQQFVICIQSIIAHHLDEAIRPLRAAKQIKDVPVSFIFNTWTGLIHYYLMNRQVFAPDQSVIAAHGTSLITDFLCLLSNTSGRERDR